MVPIIPQVTKVILGGGQLGRMLLAETQKFDIHTAVLESNKNAPCAAICNEFVVGNLLDFDAVYNFGKKVDLLTIEIENINLDALDRLEAEGLKIFPKPKDLRIIQSKAIQKKFYLNHQIPTAAFHHFEYFKELKQSYENKSITFPFVWKAARFGYDGNGVKVVRNIEDLNSLPNEECITEELIPFKNELAVIVARNEDGETKTYPVVEMEFHPEANQVEYVICPARIDSKIAKKAREVALKVVNDLDFIGLLAVEMFQTKEDEILVNAEHVEKVGIRRIVKQARRICQRKNIAGLGAQALECLFLSSETKYPKSTKHRLSLN